MKQFKRSVKYGVVLASTALVSVASADIVTDATTELATLKTSASAMGTPIIAIVGAVALIGIIVMLVRRAK